VFLLDKRYNETNCSTNSTSKKSNKTGFYLHGYVILQKRIALFGLLSRIVSASEYDMLLFSLPEMCF